MAEQNVFCVGGYRFGSKEDAEQAEIELKKVMYFDDKLEGRHIQTILAVYDKMLDEKMFSTPIGWEYLRTLQERLISANVPKESIRPIPMYVVFAHKEEQPMRVRDRIRPTRKVSKDKKNFHISLLVNIFLAVLVLAMFLITLKSDNPNVLNYKQVITDQYASWEQELTEREEKVRKKEAELFAGEHGSENVQEETEN